MDPTPPTATAIPFLTPDWPVLHLDNHLLALYKPAGLLVQGDRTADPSLLELAKDWLRVRYHKPGRVFLGLVHRLDRPVAGVVLLARTSKAAGRLSDQFRRRTTVKEYLAVVHGRPPATAGRLVHHLERRDRRSSRLVARPTAASQEARLSYRVLATTGDRSLLQVRLETGRKHQIRLQLAGAGCPILGDLRYGAPAPLPRAAIALLAWRLTIHHPVGGAPLTFTSPTPAGWPWPEPTGGGPAPPWHWREIEPRLTPTAGGPGDGQ